MSVPLSELRDYRTTTRQMLVDGADPLSVALTVDSRLVDVANQVAVCHRVIAQAKAEMRFAFFPGRKVLRNRIESAGEVLEELEQIQNELLDVKGACLLMLRTEIGRMQSAIGQLLERP